MKEYIHLFTPVSEGLPEKGFYLTIHKTGYIIYSFYNGEQWIGSNNNALEYISHYLDLSRLTTKERAIELARHSYNEGRVGQKEGLNAKEHGTKFIEQNKGRL